MKKTLLVVLLALCAPMTFAQTLPSYVPTDGLLGYWPFNGNANDESGNGNNGTVNGATLTTDRNGNANSAYSFDGNNNYIESICSNLPLGNSSRSVSAWVNMPSLNYNNTNFISSWGYGDASQTSANKAFGFLTALNGMWLWQSFGDSQNNEYFSTTFLPNNYYHVVATVDNSGLFKFYINSVLVYTNQIIGMNTISNGGVLRIGRSTHTNTDGWAGYFLGKIDDLAIYNRALTQEEITQLYTTPAQTPAPTASVQTFCGATTAASLVATGTELKWYAAATGGTALASNVALASGTYYVSQTLNTIESDRTAVIVTVNEAQITASANTVSSGTAVNLSATSNLTNDNNQIGNVTNSIGSGWTQNFNVIPGNLYKVNH